MKIGDIEVGVEYAVAPQRRYYGQNPRQVKVLAIETVEVEQWASGYSSGRITKKMRHVKVKFLDEKTAQQSWRSHDGDYSHIAKGAVLTIEPRYVQAKWSEVRPEIVARMEKEQKEAELKQATYKRVRALLTKRGEREDFSEYDVRVRGGVRVEVELEGRALERILTLAEAASQTEGATA